MGSVDQVDDRTFRVNFTGDGAEKLRDRVNEKLKEFMGDYTDDTLVEYVIVLLKNGRRKEEARNELNVFLGDDTDSFVSWLWDHLATHIGLYVEPEESCADDEVIKAQSPSADKLGRSDSHKLDSESARGKPSRESKIRHNREWKGLVRDASDPPPLRSSEVENIHLDERSHRRERRTRRSPSKSAGERKRSRADEQQNTKREATQVSSGATRRLLQFAVRDAVGTPRASNTTTEPSLKRLRSVVSTPTGDLPLVDRPRRIKSVARVVNPMASVIKAVAEAAEDAERIKSSGSVFDRLGQGTPISRPHNLSGSYVEPANEGAADGDASQLHKQRRSTYLQRSDHRGQYADNTTILGNDASDENGRYDDVNAMCRSGTNVSQPGRFGGNKDEEMVDYSVAQNSDNLMRLKRTKGQDQHVVALSTLQKNVNNSVNSSTWKLPNYQEPREAARVDDWKPVHEGNGGAPKSAARMVIDNNNHLALNGNKKPATDSQKELQKTVLPATGQVASRPLEDSDSRTLFVSNVHFAATKDSLSRHFNKFGDVLKVLIVTDAATGQPTGSAYVEFMRKEAADNALSLDGTSFMSRLLKVVKRSAGQQEAATTWPWMPRGTPFSGARFPRGSFPRGMAGSFRGRHVGKPGGRSFQWKRDAQPSSSESVPSPTTNTSINAPRSLTYVRPEPKPEANAGTA